MGKHLRSWFSSFYCVSRGGKSSFSRTCCISAAGLAFCVVLYAGLSSLQQQQQQHQNESSQQQQQQVVPPQLLLSEVGVTAGEGERLKLEKVKKNSEMVVEGGRNKYVVETSNCKIPEMDPFDITVRNFLKPDSGFPVDCMGTHKKWTFMDGTELAINKSAVQVSGYSLNSIYCCYRIIERVEQPWSDFNINADNYVKYSDKCHPIATSGTKIDAEFIRVHCISKLPPLYNDVVYRDFFAIAQPSSDRLVAKKLYQWKQKSFMINASSSSSMQPPPNVVIIGIDNNSRMNSHRHLKKTLEALRTVGAVELRGYTKVAENTFPNTVPFLSGYSEKELSDICYESNAAPQDDCPYIWKAFDKANYLTVHAEDSPYLGGFNYLKTGFVKKPTDFYLRPLMLAVMTFMPRIDYYHTDCIGRHMTDQFTFNYILDTVRLASSHSTPIFVHSWLTSLAHHSYNNLQFGDDTIANFIHGLVNVSNDNTIFFLFSDHGQRYGPIRETTQGWYEDKLPTQWVYIPKRISSRYPNWNSNLQTNAGRLTSHFDVYKTMLHILKTFNPTTSGVEEFYSTAEHQYGMSLFEPIPENRTCEQAGITVNYCACAKPRPVDINDPKVLEAAKVSLEHLASVLPLDVCAQPTLKSIVTAGFMDLPGKSVYVITFMTEPGDFLFEVNVEQEQEGQDKVKFVITTDFLRMNKITRKVDCVKTPLLERYCYCK